MQTMSYIDARENLAHDARRGAVQLSEDAISTYLASRNGAAMTPDAARQMAAAFMEDLRAGVARESAMAPEQPQRSRSSDRRPAGGTRR